MWRQQKAAKGTWTFSHFSFFNKMSTTMKPANCSLHFIWPEITGFHIKIYIRKILEMNGEWIRDRKREHLPVWATSDNVALVVFIWVFIRCCIVVAGIILRHLSQSWHDWLKDTTGNWTGQLHQLPQLQIWPNSQAMSTQDCVRPIVEIFISHTADGSYIYADDQFGQQSETLIMLFGPDLMTKCNYW